MAANKHIELYAILIATRKKLHTSKANVDADDINVFHNRISQAFFSLPRFLPYNDLFSGAETTFFHLLQRRIKFHFREKLKKN